MKKLIKKYLFFFITSLIMIVVFILNKEIGTRAVNTTLYSLKEMVLILPPIFILLGLLDVWVPRETMVKFMGEDSGLKGIILAIIIGSAAAGPLYAAFPIAAIFMKKGVKFSNILLFLGAWSTTKIPMLLFEISALGLKFALTRLVLSIIGIAVITIALDKLISTEEKDKIYEKLKDF